MAYADLSKEEKDILAKLGITAATFAPKQTRAKGDKAPKTVDLTKMSGEVILNCDCCGAVEKYYVDYVSRQDDTGFAIRRVEVPTHPVTREHLSHVIVCNNCKLERLAEHSQAGLISMILHLRGLLRRN
jgi:hypothetical protein